MLRFPALVIAPALAACAPVPPVERPTGRPAASTDLLPQVPEPPPVPLAPVDPATRLQSEIEGLSHGELARWILPPELQARIVAHDLLRMRTGRVSGIALYERPHQADFPGVCSLQVYSVWVRVPNESTLTHQQHLNPPLEPYQYTPLRRWKVGGSTLAGAAPPDCASVRPSRDWIEAPSAKMVYRAVNLVEQAQRGRIRPRLDCQQWRYDETLKVTVFPRCPDARVLLAQLRPDLIKRIQRAACVPSQSPMRCLGIEYHDPAAPNTHSIYVVTIPGEDRPGYIRITQTMLPPH